MKLDGILPGSQFLLPPNPAIYCLNPWLTVHEWHSFWFPVFAKKFTLGSACSCLCRWVAAGPGSGSCGHGPAPVTWGSQVKKFTLGLNGVREWCWLCEHFNKCSWPKGRTSESPGIYIRTPLLPKARFPEFIPARAQGSSDCLPSQFWKATSCGLDHSPKMLVLHLGQRTPALFSFLHSQISQNA